MRSLQIWALRRMFIDQIVKPFSFSVGIELIPSGNDG